MGRGAYLQGMDAWARGAHTAEEAGWLIHQQELHAVLMGINAFGSMLAGRMVECQVDSTVALTYIANGGGKDPWMNHLTRRIHWELQAVGASLYKAVWIRGAQNQEADCMSRVDLDDWQLRDSTIFQIKQAFGGWQVDRSGCLLSGLGRTSQPAGASTLLDCEGAAAFGRGSSCSHPGVTLLGSSAMVANPTEGVVELDPSWVRLGDGQARTIRQF